jgi:hypothetical protein
LRNKCRDPTADSIRLYIRIKSASGVETIFDIDVRVGASEEAKVRRKDLLIDPQKNTKRISRDGRVAELGGQRG